MAMLRIRYLIRKPGRAGTTRFFWQPHRRLLKEGFRPQRLSDIESQAMIEAEELNRRLDAWRDGIASAPAKVQEDSVTALIRDYKKSRFWIDLAPKTKQSYALYTTLIERWAGDAPARTITPPLVQRLYEAHQHTPAKASYMIRVLRVVMSHAERLGWIPKGSNPASKPMIKYRAAKGKPWSPAAVATFVRHADRLDEFAIGTAVYINEWFGQRLGDLLEIKGSDYKNGSITLDQNKTGASVTLPVDQVPHIRDRIHEQIMRNKNPDGPIIQKADGTGMSVSWVSHRSAEIRDAGVADCPDLVGLILKDLRHTAVQRLAEAGAQIPEIAAITGHSFRTAQSIIDRYNVRTIRMAQSAFTKRLNAQTKGENHGDQRPD